MILVTGATGHVGRETVRLLLAAGGTPAAVTRHPATATLPEGTHLIDGDPSRPDTLAAHLPGVEAILLSPRAVGPGVTGLLALAAEHGVRRVVALSAMTVAHPAGQRRFIEEFTAVEDAVRASGLGRIILRCADFAANTLAWAPQLRSGDVVRGAFGAASTATIDERDIAAVAVRVLRGCGPDSGGGPDDGGGHDGGGHDGRSYLLTGPGRVDQYDKVRAIGDATGRALSFMELPPDEVRRAMLSQGLPDDVPEWLLGSLADYAAHPGPVSADVERILGRPARSYATWAADHAAAFRNGSPS